VHGVALYVKKGLIEVFWAWSSISGIEVYLIDLISNALIFTELCRAVVGTQMYCVMWTARPREVLPGFQASRTCCSKVSC